MLYKVSINVSIKNDISYVKLYVVKNSKLSPHSRKSFNWKQATNVTCSHTFQAAFLLSVVKGVEIHEAQLTLKSHSNPLEPVTKSVWKTFCPHMTFPIWFIPIDFTWEHFQNKVKRSNNFEFKSSHLCVVGHKKWGSAVMLHEEFGEESNPSVVAVEDDPFACTIGLPDEIILQKSWRVQVHHNINEARDAAGGQSLMRTYERTQMMLFKKPSNIFTVQRGLKKAKFTHKCESSIHNIAFSSVISSIKYVGGFRCEKTTGDVNFSVEEVLF